MDLLHGGSGHTEGVRCGPSLGVHIGAAVKSALVQLLLPLHLESPSVLLTRAESSALGAIFLPTELTWDFVAKSSTCNLRLLESSVLRESVLLLGSRIVDD